MNPALWWHRRVLGYSLLYWWPRQDQVTPPDYDANYMSGCGCAMQAAQHVNGRLTCPTLQQTILLYTQVQYQRGTGGTYVERAAETQTSIGLASHLVKAPISQSGRHEFESSARTWTRLYGNIEDFWAKVFYNKIFTIPIIRKEYRASVYIFASLLI